MQIVRKTLQSRSLFPENVSMNLSGNNLSASIIPSGMSGNIIRPKLMPSGVVGRQSIRLEIDSLTINNLDVFANSGYFTAGSTFGVDMNFSIEFSKGLTSGGGVDSWAVYVNFASIEHPAGWGGPVRQYDHNGGTSVTLNNFVVEHYGSYFTCTHDPIAHNLLMTSNGQPWNTDTFVNASALDFSGMDSGDSVGNVIEYTYSF